jgi:hypothetical protein
MSRRLSVALALTACATLATIATAPSASAKVLNVEFKFTPFVGDPVHEDHVQVVAGKATLYLNRVPIAERDVEAAEAMVLFDEREVQPTLWLPVESAGPVLRRGKNVFRVEFVPRDAKAAYHAQLRWANVLDATSEETHEGGGSATNQAGEGVDDRAATGPVAIEHEFSADFATDLPWHHAAPIADLTPADEQAIAKLVAARVALFRPDFAAAYAWLAGRDGLDVPKMRQAKCLEQAYAAGVRVEGPAVGGLEIVAVGNPEVIMRGKGRPLFVPTDPKTFEKIPGEETQLCASAALFTLFPARLAVVRGAKGAWEVVY